MISAICYFDFCSDHISPPRQKKDMAQPCANFCAACTIEVVMRIVWLGCQTKFDSASKLWNISWHLGTRLANFYNWNLAFTLGVFPIFPQSFQEQYYPFQYLKTESRPENNDKNVKLYAIL